MVDIDSRARRKERGAFFTPPALADFLSQWGVRDESDVVLEPSCGEAVFLEAAGLRLRSLGGEPTAGQLIGVDLHEESIVRARRRLSTVGLPARLTAGDFFALSAPGPVDVVLGNPPYIRYQDFSGASRARARRAALAAGVALSALASSWAAFTVHAATFLARGGRMGLVLPAELLSVNYAAGVREFLLRRFSTVRLVLFTERVFPEVQEEVVLLLAEDYDPQGEGTDHFELMQVEDAAALARASAFSPWRPASPGEKWTHALGHSPAYEALVASGLMTPLSSWGRIALGAVTGANTFFALSPARAEELRLGQRDVVPLSPPGSLHLRALTLTIEDLDRLGQQGAGTVLLHPGQEPSPAARAYIRRGEAAGVAEAYKCRVRSPWWRVPLQPVADLFLTYMNASSVALCANEAGAHHLNSVHGLFLDDDARELPAVIYALAFVNSVTALGAELVGRAYGGGMLKLEPREAGRLPVPSLECLRVHRGELAELVPSVRDLLREGRREEAEHVVDDVLNLAQEVGADGLAQIRMVRDGLVARRATRGKAGAR